MKTLTITIFLNIIALFSFTQVNNNLQAFYSFNDSTVNDHSGNQQHAVDTNINYAADRFGNARTAASFNGTSSVITLPDSLILWNPITISMWFKTSNSGVLLGHQNTPFPTNASSRVPVLYIGTNGVLKGSFWGNGVSSLDTTNSIVNDNQWHHLVITADMVQGQELFLDSHRIGSGTNYHVLTNMLNNQLGAGHTGGGWVFANGSWFLYNGLMDDVRIYDKRLSRSEIDSLYQEPNPFSTSLIENQFNHQLKLFPNPTTDMISIQFSNKQAKIDQINIFDFNGRLLKSIRQPQESIDMSDLANGNYLLRFSVEGNHVIKKVIKN